MLIHASRNEKDQCSLWQIIGIWASVVLPTDFIFWVEMPILIPLHSFPKFNFIMK